jgi:hypothetical protein
MLTKRNWLNLTLEAALDTLQYKSPVCGKGKDKGVGKIRTPTPVRVALQASGGLAADLHPVHVCFDRSNAKTGGKR